MNYPWLVDFNRISLFLVEQIYYLFVQHSYLLEERFYFLSIMYLLYPLKITLQFAVNSFFGEFDEILSKATFLCHFLFDLSLHHTEIFIVNDQLKHLK